MGGDHDHGAGLARAGERHKGRLIAAFVLIGGFFVVEAVAGIWTNSLALLSDAAHMLTDVVGIGMALAAIQLASRFEQRASAARSGHTFGLYRLEILAAFVRPFSSSASSHPTPAAAQPQAAGSGGDRSAEGST